MIEQIEFLAQVAPENIQKIKPLVYSFSKGQTVHHQGDMCLALEIVISGHLVAYGLSEKGSETIVFNFSQNSTIGANLLFGTAHRYPMNIYCTQDTDLLRIPLDLVKDLLHDYAFAMSFITSLSLNAQGLNKRIAMYTQNNLRQNLMNYLESLKTDDTSRPMTSKGLVTLPMSKKQLADYMGVQRPSLFRELKKMKDEGLIQISNKTITLLYSD